MLTISQKVSKILRITQPRTMRLLLAVVVGAVSCLASTDPLLWDRAMQLHRQEQWGASIPLLLELLAQSNGTNTTVEVELGFAYHRDEQLQLAVAHYERVLAVDPRHPVALANLGTILVYHDDSRRGLGFLQRALAADPALEPHIAQHLGVAYQHTGMPHIAEQFLDKVPVHMRTAQYHFDRGVVLEKQGKIIEASVEFNNALEKDEHFSSAWLNIAALHHQYGSVEDAIRCYKNALRIPSSTKELQLMTMSNLGTAFEMSEDIHAALHWYDQALQLTSEMTPTRWEESLDTKVMLKNHKARAKRTAGIWSGLEAHTDEILHLVVHEQLRHGFRPSLLPFDSLLSTMDPLLRLQLAREYSLAVVASARHLFDAIKANASDLMLPPNDKLCVGYISYDFADHPTAHLMEGLFAAHDRERFDVVVYGYGRDDGSDFRVRLLDLLDEFVNLAVDSVELSVQKIRSRGIDVLMDAQGHTRGGRPMIIATKPARVLVNYLVYPGTSGAPYIDYLITDRLVTPPETMASHFSEKLVLLPYSYQVNYYPEAVVPGGRSTLWSEPEVEVEAAQGTENITDSGSDDWFTFVNFNKIDKLEPAVFSLWMAIMRRVPKSRLLLLDPTKSGSKRSGKKAPVRMSTRYAIKANLRLEAAAHGIVSERLHFVPRVPKRKHLPRHRYGGLFLDTLVYGAHSTATDAMYAGLPVLTLAGDTFASRVGMSLLENAGLPELITHSRKEFEDIAVMIATERPLLSRFKEQLRGASTTAKLPPLFRTNEHVATLEEAQQAMATLSRRADNRNDSTLRTAHLIVVA